MVRFGLMAILVTALSGCGGGTGDDSPDAAIQPPQDGSATFQDATSPSDGGGSTGRTGLEGFCDYYKECGGTYYATAQDCIDATLGYWGECRRSQLDAFGDCMMAEVECSEWNPDVYNPANTPCADEWSAVQNAQCLR